MIGRTPFILLAALVLLRLTGGLAHETTLSAFIATDSAQGFVRAGVWATATPGPTPRPSPHSIPTKGVVLGPTPTPTSRAAPSATPGAGASRLSAPTANSASSAR